MVEEPQLEIFKIGRMRIIFPPDLTEDELQFASMILYSYIQNVRYKNSKEWSVKERIEIKKSDIQAGVS